MQSWSRDGAAGSRGTRSLPRAGVALLGAVALAVLPACTEDTTQSADESTAQETASTTTTGGEADQADKSPGSSSEPTSRSGASSTSTGEAEPGGSRTDADEGDRASADAETTPKETKGADASGRLHRVIRVVDGDTVEVDIDGGESVRVIGIDTPETVDPDEPVECGGPEASEAAHEMLDGKSVEVVFDPSQGRRDKYGRLLAYLDVPGAGDFGEAMIREGHAEEYTYDTAYERQGAYRSAEEQARGAAEGIWGGCSQHDAPAESSPAPEPSQPPEPAPTQAPAPEPTQPPAPSQPPAPEPPSPGPADAGSAPAAGYTNDTLTPGYTGCRQGYPGGKISGVYWWKPISC